MVNTGTRVPNNIASHPRVSFVHHGSREYQDALLKAGTLINNTTFPPYFVRKSDQLYVNTYHGIPAKKMGRDIDDTLESIANTQRNFVQATYLLSGGDYTDDRLFRPYGVMPLLRSSIVHTGYPRIELAARTDVRALRAQLGLEDGKPVILYAPT